ncbi:MAG: hypothetical protein WC455_25730 [Dehalococcoidia bacterium]
MPTPMIQKQWADYLTPSAKVWWSQTLNPTASPLMQFMSIRGSSKPTEYSQGIGSFGLVPEYNAATAEGNGTAIHYDSFSSLYEATFTHKEYADGVEIERKLWDDGREMEIRSRIMTLAMAFTDTRAYQASGILNNAFATVTGYDSVYLCSASHPTNTVDSTAISNLGTTALSYAAVVATLLAGSNFKNDRGLPLPSRFNVLYVPTALESTAYEIINAIQKPGAADYNGNFISSVGLRVVVDEFLTDTNNWFMIDTAKASMHAIWYNHTLPEFEYDPTGAYNLVARYRGYMRHSYGWDDFRWVYGHSVT